MEIQIPKLSLVVLVGVSSSGKSSFAKKHFLPTEIISSDFCRGLVSDDENSMPATGDAFDVLHFIARKRLAAGKLTVVDATNVQIEARKPLIALAKEFHCIPVALVIDLPESVCQARNKVRPDRDLHRRVIEQQRMQLRRSLRGLKREGFSHVFILSSEQEVDEATITRVPLWNDKTDCHGPFDIIGDVHGCYDELTELLEKLGYVPTGMSPDVWTELIYAHPENRQAIFLGDIVDRGPKVVETLKLVYDMVKAGHALCVPGNHDLKLMKKLRGQSASLTHGLAETMEQINRIPEAERGDFNAKIGEFLYSLVSHYVLDSKKLAVAHAGVPAEMQGRGSAKVREFCLFGQTTGETDEFGLPVRYDWAAEYRGSTRVVYGHTPIPEPEWLNNTINIDTGCVFGGRLTALRYPENELISVSAKKTYYEPARPLMKPEVEGLKAQQIHDDLLNIDDVIGKRFIRTRLAHTVTVREENAVAALEVMSRFAANPKWLIYLPPTMSPPETSSQPGFLEYPTEAFDYYRSRGVSKVICEEKHMGSRAVAIICKSEAVAASRFGVTDEGKGIVYTRTGRRFFEDRGLEQELVERLKRALESAGVWQELNTDWICLDCELMPWSAKAQELLKTQYAAVGTSAGIALHETISELERTESRQDLDLHFSVQRESQPKVADVDSLIKKLRHLDECNTKFISAYRRYCWPVASIDDLKLAPFHILASEGGIHVDKDHLWHMDIVNRISATGDKILISTPNKVVELCDQDSVDAAIRHWEETTEGGAEGMVVKPLDFLAFGRGGLCQPAVKCRGREYLRIIYGSDYTLEEHLRLLRQRKVSGKQSLAIREFALGIEALERFQRHEPLRQVHECVFGVLALESEPIDPRL